MKGVFIINKCEWLHRKLEDLPLIKYPFELDELPKNGIYFFYENGQKWGHQGDKPRIVRIGTHKGNNFRSRINDHYLFKERKMNFNKMKSAPKDRSIFRKNIGRAMLNNDRYLEIWNIDFTKRKTRDTKGHLRDIDKEKYIENKITDMLRNNFSFRFLLFSNQLERMGSKGIESSLIGTVAQCEECKPSNSWLGNFSPDPRIRGSGLWLVQHLKANPINGFEQTIIEDALKETEKWIRG